MHLYLIPFQYEPLVKVGKADWPRARWRDLGLDRLDPERACVLHSHQKPLIDRLEEILLMTFGGFQRLPDPPLSSGNTEVFDDSVYPDMLMIVWSFANADNTGLELELIPDDMVYWLDYYQQSKVTRDALVSRQHWKRLACPGLTAP
jgi:hypothetical protein